MARELLARLMIDGEFEALTPIHVGGVGLDVDADLPLARNGAGDFYVPGTSFAGALRAWCSRTMNRDIERLWWGYQEPRRTRDRTPTDERASHVLIEDAVVKLPVGATVEIRDGVGIDRVTGAAATRIKYDRAVLPKGCRIPLAMTVELPPDGAGSIEAATGCLLDLLKSRGLRIGAAQTRGLGHVRLDRLEIKKQRLDTPRGIIDCLESGGESLDIDQMRKAAALDLKPAAILDVSIQWRADGPVMVKAGEEGLAVDMLPLMSGSGDGVAPVIPGSAIKGVFRSYCERIVRTVLKTPAKTDRNPRKNFLLQVDEPLIRWLFGAAAKAEKKKKQKRRPDAGDGEPLPGLGAFAVDDCFADQTIQRDQWEAIRNATAKKENNRETSSEKVLGEALEKAGKNAWVQAFHVAVDRWTGGAADRFLYNVLEPHDLDWGEIRARVDFQRLPSNLRAAGMALILLLLRDFAARRIPVGFAGNRGMGALSVDRIQLDCDGLGDVHPSLGDQTHTGITANNWGTLPDELIDHLDQAWRTWIENGGKEASDE